MFQTTKALKKILATRTVPDRKRGLVVQGGTSAAKTISIMLYLIERAQTQEKAISVVSESLPHLKRGAMRDFLNIMKTHRYYKENDHNKTDYLYQFGNGYIEFFGGDDPSKLRGPRRDILFMNEANNMPFSTFEQLEVRTKDEWIIDFNPTSEFWAHTEVIPRMECDFLKLTYRDNDALEPSIVRSIESRRHNRNWWTVYGEGEIGTKEGQIYAEWPQLDDIPETAELVRYGLDFGYTNDPTAIVAVYRWNNTLILDECVYQVGLTNPQIAKKLQELPEALVIADSAEPKSIDEIKHHGINIIGAVKGPGSVNYGIQTVQDQRIYVTKRSTELIRENRNYLWKLDRDGRPLNVPEDMFNHALDAVRYAVSDIVGKPELDESRFAFI